MRRHIFIVPIGLIKVLMKDNFCSKNFCFSFHYLLQIFRMFLHVNKIDVLDKVTEIGYENISFSTN